MPPVMLAERPTLLVADPIEDATRREFVTGIGAAALAAAFLAACGADGAAGTPEGPATRGFIDVTGKEIQVPARAQRIVAIHDLNGGAQLLSLGAPVVGISTRDTGFNADLTKHFTLDGIEGVGITYEPDLEAIIALEPDLIVGEGYNGAGMDQFMAADIQARLEEIAPVVYIDTFRPVEEVMADFVELIGGETGSVLAGQQETLDALIEEIRGLLGDAPGEITASLVGINGGTLDAWGPTHTCPTDIMTRAGVTWVPIMVEAGKPENGGYIGGLSVERMNEFDADLVLVQTVWDPSILDEPLYAALRAVRAGQMIDMSTPFDGAHYPNYIAVAQFLRDGLKALAPLRADLV